MTNKMIKKKLTLEIYDYEDRPLRDLIDYLIGVDESFESTVTLEFEYYGYDGGITYEAAYEELETDEERAKRLAAELSNKLARKRSLVYAIEHQKAELAKLEEALNS